jgi:hypothetical protein
MPEPKPVVETSAKVADLKKREAELADTRNALKTQILALIEGHIGELKDIGFDFVLTENGATSTARVCSQCHQAGHTKATCPQTKK